MSEIASVPATAETSLSQGQRLIYALTDPPRTFRDLTRNAAWWLPFLVFCVVSVAYVMVIQQRVGWELVAHNNMAMNPSQAEQMERMSAEERARAEAFTTQFTKVISYAFPVIWLLVMAVVALILMATFNFGLGGAVPFKVALAIVIYASFWPGVVSALLASVALVAGADPESFNIQNPIATNLGHAVNVTESPVLYAFLSQLDILMFWTLILTAIGFASVDKVKRSTALLVVFGWYAVRMLMAVGSTALFT